MPEVITVNKFTEDSAKTFHNDIEKAKLTTQKTIPIVVDSFGGQVYALLSMIDSINELKRQGYVVATVAKSKAMSCGAILLSFGTDGHRYITPNTTVMIHDVAAGASGKIEELKVSANEAQRLQDQIFSMLDENCGKEKGYFDKEIKSRGRADWFLNSKETKKLGLANHIGNPSFNIEFIVNETFGISKQ